ncbi:uncharacterized protein [Rutidosis leptorrhynchoides]|uniref:uncharacterized protein n=1 Tax=Rutidosis leptorrhynchoides TaxID=125765 RepID=UPI003A99DF43
MISTNSRKRTRSTSDDDSAEAKRVLLDILDDSDSYTLSQDLDSFMKSFQDEISPAPDVLTESGESQPELGFLFEASDDELGLPPTEKSRDLAVSVEDSELWGLDEQITSYDSFEYEYGYGDVNITSNVYNSNISGGEYVALDGLFDHTDLGFGSSDLLWQPETLPAQ